MKHGMLWSNVWKWRVKEEIRWELKGGCDIKPVKKGKDEKEKWDGSKSHVVLNSRFDFDFQLCIDVDFV